jgi:hypothetical protein
MCFDYVDYVDYVILVAESKFSTMLKVRAGRNHFMFAHLEVSRAACRAVT